MTLDRRLKDALQRASEDVDPAVELRLERTIKRAAARDRAPVGNIVAVLLIVAVALVGLRYSGLIDGIIGSRPPDLRAVAGTYSVSLRETDEAVTSLGLAGEWSLTLSGSGAIELRPPATFAGSQAQGHTYSLDGHILRTDLYYNDYCDSIGVFTWERTATELILTPAVDECQIRRVLLGTRAWTLTP
jgi:hypothetical protein